MSLVCSFGYFFLCFGSMIHMCLCKVSQVFILSGVYWSLTFYKFSVFLNIISLNAMWPLSLYLTLRISCFSIFVLFCLTIPKVSSLFQFLWSFFPVLELCNFYWSILKLTDIFICHIGCYWAHPVNSVLRVEHFSFKFFIGLNFFISICWNVFTLYSFLFLWQI